MSWCWRPSSRRTARCWAWTHATVWTGSSRLPTDKRDHQARCASSAARTGATSPTYGVTTIAARPRRHIHYLKSARSAAKEGCGNLVECSMLREAGVVWRYDVEQQGNPRPPRQRWRQSRKRLQCNAEWQGRVQRPTTAPRQRCEPRNTHRSNAIRDNRLWHWTLCVPARSSTGWPA